MNYTPWIFGDEYLYLSKARNIARGIDILADVSQGHTYPPLYSYLISLVMGSDPLISYQSVQKLNILISQLLILLSLYLLNRVFKWTKSRSGILFLILAYLSVSPSTVITGFYSVAMSENLYTPLVILAFSLFIFINHCFKKRNKSNFLLIIALALISALAYLTRTIGIALIVASTFGIFTSLLKSKRRIIKSAFFGMVVLIFSFAFIYLFKIWENSQIVNLGLAQRGYEDLQSNYWRVIQDHISLKANWFWSIKILGNHFVYLIIGSFFLPFYFLIKDLLDFLKSKKVKTSTLFLIAYALVAGSLSFLHCYSGFKGGQAIKYSTYFRYIDQVVVLLNIYGLTSLWKMIKQKETINKKAVLFFLISAVVALIFLPNRDFYTTLNSFGWGWLDIFLNPVWLGRVIGILLLFLTLFTFWKKNFYYFFIIVTLVLQTLTLPKIFAMHRWLSSDFQALIKPIKTLALEQKTSNFYITESYLEKDLLGSLYFAKYLLLFYGNKFEPIQVVETKNLELLKNDYVYLASPAEIEKLDNIFSSQLIINEKLIVAIKQVQAKN